MEIHAVDTKAYLIGMEEKEWKYRRACFYSTRNDQDFDDYLNEDDIEIIERFDDEDIMEDAILYLTTHREALYYPGKSFAIAVIYANKINEHFGDDVRETLKDPDLLFDDPYFEPYNENTEDIYEEILGKLGDGVGFEVDENLPYLQRTLDYCEQELMLNEDTKLFI